jgi:hypothetical protein
MASTADSTGALDLGNGDRNPIEFAPGSGFVEPTIERRDVQFGDRQQTSGLSLDAFACARCLSWPNHGITGANPSTENSPTRAIRNHRTDARCRVAVNYLFQTKARGFSVPQPRTHVAAPFHTAVRADCGPRASSSRSWLARSATRNISSRCTRRGSIARGARIWPTLFI